MCTDRTQTIREPRRMFDKTNWQTLNFCRDFSRVGKKATAVFRGVDNWHSSANARIILCATHRKHE